MSMFDLLCVLCEPLSTKLVAQTCLLQAFPEFANGPLNSSLQECS